MGEATKLPAAIDPQDHYTGFMLSVGVRYCLDRHSYAPGLCCDWLRSHWHLLAERSRSLITRDIQRHIDSEHQATEIRARNGGGPAGWEDDLRTWERMLAWICERGPALIAQAEQGAPHGE